MIRGTETFRLPPALIRFSVNVWISQVFSPGAEIKPTSFHGLPQLSILLLFPASKTFTCAHRETRCCSLTAVLLLPFIP